jgi:hypothetical protein
MVIPAATDHDPAVHHCGGERAELGAIPGVLGIVEPVLGPLVVHRVPGTREMTPVR